MKSRLRVIMTSTCLSFVFLNFNTRADSGDIDFYYTGEAKIFDLKTGLNQSQKVIMKKSMRPNTQSISEIACFQSAGRASEISPVYMKINVEGAIIKLKISDSKYNDQTLKLTGEGELYGPDWNWNLLKFHMNYKDGFKQAKIEDVNFVVGSKLIGRKQLYYPNGEAFQLYELEMELIDKAGFEQRSLQMKCPPIID